MTEGEEGADVGDLIGLCLGSSWSSSENMFLNQLAFAAFAGLDAGVAVASVLDELPLGAVDCSLAMVLGEGRIVGAPA